MGEAVEEAGRDRVAGKDGPHRNGWRAPLDAENLHEIKASYSEILGLVVASKQPGRHVFFQVGRGSRLLFFNPQATRVGDTSPSHGTTSPGHVALGIQAESLEAWRPSLEEKGVAIEKKVVWPLG